MHVAFWGGKYNCVTVLHLFLLYKEVNQLYIHTPLWELLPTPLQVIAEHRVSSLCYTAASHWLFVLHGVVYIR